MTPPNPPISVLKVRRASLLILATLLATACKERPRFGEVHVSKRAPNATVGGVTAPEEPAVGMAESCSGHISTSPEHLVTVGDITGVRVIARSDRGPLVLVAKRDGETLCNTDDNEGLRPTLELGQPGTYAVFVGSLQSMEALPYTLQIAPEDTGEKADADADAISVAVTSDPAGAAVTSPGGEFFGKTPTILLLAPGETEANLRVSLNGYKTQELTGTATEEELRLHATLERAGPQQFSVSAEEPVPVQDFKTASQQVTVDGTCTIKELEVDVSVTHPYIADLIIQLENPQGRKAMLHRGARGRPNVERTYSSKSFRGLRGFAGGASQGTWTLTVRDREEEDQGTLNSFALRITCAELDNGAS